MALQLPRLLIGGKILNGENVVRYFCLLATPHDRSNASKEFGGAYINCWIDTEDRDVALTEARAHLAETGWLVVDIEEDYVVCADDDIDEDAIPFKDGDDEYYELAKQDGACYVLHTWPVGADDDDE